MRWEVRLQMRNLQAKIKATIKAFLIMTGSNILTAKFLVFPGAWVAADEFKKQCDFDHRDLSI
jgi:hypothetical protein